MTQIDYRAKTAAMIRHLWQEHRMFAVQREFKEVPAVCSNGQDTARFFIHDGETIDSRALADLEQYGEYVQMTAGELYDCPGTWFTAMNRQLQSDFEYYHSVKEQYEATVGLSKLSHEELIELRELRAALVRDIWNMPLNKIKAVRDILEMEELP